MAFLDDLREYLQALSRARAGNDPHIVAATIDPATARVQITQALEHLNEHHKHSAQEDENTFVTFPENSNELLGQTRGTDVVVRFAKRLEQLLRVSTGKDVPASEMKKLIEVGLARHLGLPDELPSSIRTQKLDRLGEIAREAIVLGSRERLRVSPKITVYASKITVYASAIRATRGTGHHIELTPIGRVLLELSGQDAIRWLLEVEAAQSMGPADFWRVSRETAHALINRTQWVFPSDAEHTSFPHSWNTLFRMRDFGLLSIVRSYSADKLTVLPLGLGLFSDIVNEAETPMSMLAKSLIAESSSSTAEDSVAEEYRLLAFMFLHDIRAPLGGAQAWVRAIYRQLERYPSHEWITRSRAAIDRDFAEAFSVIEQFDQFFRPVGAPTKLHQAFQALRNSTAIRLQAESIENPYSALTTVDENGADEKHGRLDHVVTPWNALPHPDALDRNGASATPSGKILVVDDARSFLDTYRTMLAPEGYELEGVTDGPSALAKLEQPGWDLVLLDRKLQGRFGPDTGLDLIQAIRERAPGAKIIIVTGVADAESVERAFAVGAYDYLEKTSYLEAILKVKVRNAMEAARERRMAALANGKREEALRELWSGVRTERDPHRKGKLLEDLVALLFKSIPGFERTETDLKSIDEQIDILIPNESTDPLWQREQSPYFLGECKHWSKPVGPAELDRFRNDIKRRYGRCRLGFFIAIGGFTSGFHSTLAAAREGDALIIAIDAEQLQSLVEATNRNAKLKELHARATMGKV